MLLAFTCDGLSIRANDLGSLFDEYLELQPDYRLDIEITHVAGDCILFDTIFVTLSGDEDRSPEWMTLVDPADYEGHIADNEM